MVSQVVKAKKSGEHGWVGGNLEKAGTTSEKSRLEGRSATHQHQDRGKEGKQGKILTNGKMMSCGNILDNLIKTLLAGWLCQMNYTHWGESSVGTVSWFYQTRETLINNIIAIK